MTNLTAELSIRAARAEIERDKAKEDLARLTDSCSAMMSRDRERLLDTLHIIGIPARDLVDIYAIEQEWQRNGGKPSLLELYRRLFSLQEELDTLKAGSS